MDSEIVFDMCNEIVKLLPQAVLPIFPKGRHLKLADALEKLKTKLGITSSHFRFRLFKSIEFIINENKFQDLHTTRTQQ